MCIKSSPLGEGRGGGATSSSLFFYFPHYVKNITKMLG